MDGIIENAVSEIQTRYNNGEWKGQTNEFGAVLWLDRPGSVSTDKIIFGNKNALDLYPQDVVEEINKSVNGKTQMEFIGEFHAHPSTVSIAGQLPSSDDLFRGSAIQDIWDDGKSAVTQHTPAIPPKIQLIILLQSGDVLVKGLDPGPYDQREINQRPDVITLYSDVFDQDVSFVGKIKPLNTPSLPNSIP